MINKNFYLKYYNNFSKLLEHVIKENDVKISKLKKKIDKVKKLKSKVILVGNGGSAATCSHVSVDLTKNAAIRAINFNEADLITCFANDYGHENWMKEAISKYYDKKDFVIIISSSGNSKNIINAVKYCKLKKISFYALSGMNHKNKLNILSKENFIWVNHKSYNFIEMAHQYILLMIIDQIISEKK